LAKICYAGTDLDYMSEGDSVFTIETVNQFSSVIFGYCIIDHTSLEITDLCVHPTMRKHSMSLLYRVLDFCRMSGKVWSIDAKSDTSYPLIKRYQKRGLIQIIDEEPPQNFENYQLIKLKFQVQNRSMHEEIDFNQILDFSLIHVLETLSNIYNMKPVI